MQKHTKIFNDFWLPELTMAQTYQCFGCNSWFGTDIHHIDNKGSGGSKLKDYLENLCCLCRSCHQKCHSDKNYNIQVRVNTLRLIADHLEGQI